MTDWTLAEFLFELRLDLTRRVLFVEGSRDLAFWRGFVPSQDRGDTVIYPITMIKCELSTGGERGRLFSIARAILASDSSGRVLFFADADCDRILGHKEPDNVVFTDGRDLESYGLTQTCLMCLCVRGVGMEETAAETVLDRVVDVTRPIGVLRVASARASLELPFQRTFETRRALRRFLVNENLDVDRLITTLLQNARISLARVGEVVELMRQENALLTEVGHDQIVHGKDFTRALAFFLDLDEQQTERLLFLSIDFADVASRPNIAQVRGWMTATDQSN